MRIIKRILPYIIGASILLAGVAYATVFNSNQVGTSPVNGYYLQTNGSTSTWAAVSGGSSSTVNLTGSSTAFYFPYWLNTNGGLSTSSPIFVSSSTGNVGIGTTSPSSTLHVIGSLRISATTTLDQLAIGSLVATDASHNLTTTLPATINATNLNLSGTLGVSSTLTVQATTTIRGALLDASGNKYSTSTGGSSSVGAEGLIQLSNGTGGFESTTTLEINSSTGQLNLPGVVISGGATPTYLSADSGSLTISYTGSIASLTVPNGVTQMRINVLGSIGGGASSTSGNGLGGSSTGTLAVTPGSVYYYCIGGQPGTGAMQGQGGFCGGGNIGGGANAYGGGGMTWLSASSTFATSSVLIVAGGGGGEGQGSNLSSNGQGGGTSGTSGGASDTGSAGGGGGGTQSAGGAGGTAGTSGSAGGAGSAGQGGAGAGSGTGSSGGGGGGYYGGGGGGSSYAHGASGGGGSGFVSSSLISTSTTQAINASTGTINIVYNFLPIVGNNTAGKITVGATPISTSTIVFAGNGFASTTNGVACFVTPINATNTAYCSANPTNASITWQNPITVGQGFYYHFLGF